ncbi:MAG: glycosyl transferase family protein [Sphingomonadaceae bacterium]
MTVVSVLHEIGKFMLHEITLFAAIGFLIGGIDELIVDMIWLIRITWRRLTIFTRFERATVQTLGCPEAPGNLAVFVPAWDEGPVIGAMVKHALAMFADQHVHMFVGCYPNDPKTLVTLAVPQSQRLTIAINKHDGPTTKADCLNTIWHSMLDYEVKHSMRFKAIVLHDAEDIVHPAEPAIFDRMIEIFDLVQLPVHPLIDSAAPWVSGHYCDEFAEAHAKALVVREAIGAAVPAAGVGCAISRLTLDRIAELNNALPFDASSLTEDYELGLRTRELGGRTALIRICERSGGPIVAVRAYFPSTIETAVRQKTRWTIGIALAGWDRLGWDKGWLENWMRLRDRKAPFAALVLTAGYASVLFYTLLWLATLLTGSGPAGIDPSIGLLLSANGCLLFWRLAIRAILVTREYDWREGLKSVPRTFIGNMIAILAARRAVFQYAQMLRTNTINWDKTTHHFPDQLL